MTDPLPHDDETGLGRPKPVDCLGPKEQPAGCHRDSVRASHGLLVTQIRQERPVYSQASANLPVWGLMARVLFWSNIAASYMFVAAAFPQTGSQGRQAILIFGWFAPVWVPILYFYYGYMLLSKGIEWWQGGLTDAFFFMIYPLSLIATFMCLAPRKLKKHLRRWRIERCLCPSCGYDLRESPQRCPECGSEWMENSS